MGFIQSDQLFVRLSESAELSADLSSSLGNVDACCLRHQLSQCAADLALEHHQAIRRLLSRRMYGSGAALLRPLAESATTAYWFSYIATDRQISALPSDPAIETSLIDLPGILEMTGSLIPFFPAMSMIQDGLKKKGHGYLRWLHKYTHGDMPQLVRRNIALGWEEVEVQRNLLIADLLATAAAQSIATFRPDTVLVSVVLAHRKKLDAWRANYFGGSSSTEDDGIPSSPESCFGQLLGQIGAHIPDPDRVQLACPSQQSNYLADLVPVETSNLASS